MRKRVIMLVVLLTVAGAATAWAAQQMPPVVARDPIMLDGDRMLMFGKGGLPTALLSDKTPIAGFSFGPGRLEVAFCAAGSEGGRWGLWVVGAGPSDKDRERMKEAGPAHAPFWSDTRQYRTPSSPARLLWTAPEGATLRGPIWWAPNGTQIAVRAFAGERCALMIVNYASGEAVQLGEGTITATAWSLDGKWIAYVKEADGASAVWVQSFPPGEARRLGEGGLTCVGR